MHAVHWHLLVLWTMTPDDKHYACSAITSGHKDVPRKLRLPKLMSKQMTNGVIRHTEHSSTRTYESHWTRSRLEGWITLASTRRIPSQFRVSSGRTICEQSCAHSWHIVSIHVGGKLSAAAHMRKTLVSMQHGWGVAQLSRLTWYLPHQIS
jgi:hypothetical protein